MELLGQDDVDEGVHIGNVNLAVTVHIGTGAGAARQDDVDDGIDVGDIDLAVVVHIALEASLHFTETHVIHIGKVDCRTGLVVGDNGVAEVIVGDGESAGRESDGGAVSPDKRLCLLNGRCCHSHTGSQR